jgi:Uma2 family endonuclease
MNVIPDLRQADSAVPLLVNGDRLEQPEFHKRYQAHPGPEKFELIGGVVYMASPARRLHSQYQDELIYALGHYRRATPGVESLPEATSILGKESEPQPDLTLRILHECGGQSRETEDGYVEGPPELIAEVAYSSRAIDLHQKLDDYRRAGVREYLVVSVEEPQLFWFDFAGQGEIVADRKGVYRSKVFPGLWLHDEALLARDSARVLTVLQQGLAGRAHAAFVRRLERARRTSR